MIVPEGVGHVLLDRVFVDHVGAGVVMRATVDRKAGPGAARDHGHRRQGSREREESEAQAPASLHGRHGVAPVPRDQGPW